MENAYLEILDTMEWRELSRGQQILYGNYDRSCVMMGFECLVVLDSFRAKDAAAFYAELKNAGITEIYYASDASNYMDSLLAFQKAGARMAGLVELENPKYKREVERYGESYERRLIPAIKFVI